MGLLGSIIAKGVVTAAKNSTIKAVGDAVGNVAESVIVAKANNPTEQNVIMIKNDVVLIKPTRSSEDYCGENAMDIVRELIGVGFESVTLKPIHNLSERAKKRYGEIESISINGNDSFLGIKKVPATSYIVIGYLDFKKKVNEEVYASVSRIIPGIIDRNALQVRTQKDKIASINEMKKFCPFCGTTLKIENAKYCSNCGKTI